MHSTQSHLDDPDATRSEKAQPQALTSTAQAVLDRVVHAMHGAARDGQERMVREICRALSGEHLLVQAGTGTGKSLGYLVPIATDCAMNKHRSLVSTATLALQRQIVDHDAPLVVDAVKAQIGQDIHVAVLKGWSNYACLNRLNGGTEQAGLFDAEIAAEAGEVSRLGAEVLRLREWVAHTKTGDRDDLTPGVSDLAWRQASVSKRECLGKSCPMITQCFPQAARDRALEADVVVSNHSLLGIYAMNQVDLFGGVDTVVVDEAHALAQRVRDQASTTLSAALNGRMSRRVQHLAKADTGTLDEATELLTGVLSQMETGLIQRRPQPLLDAVSLVDSAVRDLYTQVEQAGVEQADKLLARGALDEVNAFLENWGRAPAQSATWVARLDNHAPELVVAPLDVSTAIGAHALGDKPAVLTSATLSVGGSFSSVAHQCGLAVSGLPWRGVDVGTPFDLAHQGILYLAGDLPAPGPEGLSPAALKRLVELARSSGGGMLALFSSWRGARAGADALRQETSLEILLQGEETTSALVDRFRDHVDSCLVATLGLWQGVDVQGPSCRLVTVDRIPFPHPQDPVFQALSLDAQRRGFNGFRTVQLPYAALLMAQGAGRLLRSMTDRGVVAVLDSRVVTKSYGGFIRRSLPALWPTTDVGVVKAALERLAGQATP